MGRQINFFISENDLISFGDYIQKEKNGTYILRTSPIDKVIIIDEILNIPYMSGYITMTSLKKEIRMKELKVGLYSVERSSPVIEFTQCKLIQNGLRSARLFYYTDFYNQDGALTKFPIEYLKWCEDIVEWIKKNYKPCPYPEFKGYRISKEVLKLVESKEIILLAD